MWQLTAMQTTDKANHFSSSVHKLCHSSFLYPWWSFPVMFLQNLFSDIHRNYRQDKICPSSWSLVRQVDGTVGRSWKKSRTTNLIAVFKQTGIYYSCHLPVPCSIFYILPFRGSASIQRFIYRPNVHGNMKEIVRGIYKPVVSSVSCLPR
jgi:hypothetical protein